MQKPKWDAKAKAMIVFEGLAAKPVTEVCTEHQISESPYYRWRDRFLADAANAFEVHQHTRKETRLEQKNARLEKLVGELFLEVKKATREWADAAPVASGDQRDERLLPRMQQLKAEHLFWGYRRIWAYLCFVRQVLVNKKQRTSRFPIGPLGQGLS
jgi:transposase-like protein